MTGVLAGKVAFVAGASRGIGATVAEALAREGAAVAVAARSEQEGKVPARFTPSWTASHLRVAAHCPCGAM